MRNAENSMLFQDSAVQYALSMPQISSGPPAFNSELNNRPFCIESGMLTKLTGVSLDPTK